MHDDRLCKCLAWWGVARGMTRNLGLTHKAKWEEALE